jgi:hypothetical protein
MGAEKTGVGYPGETLLSGFGDGIASWVQQDAQASHLEGAGSPIALLRIIHIPTALSERRDA